MMLLAYNGLYAELRGVRAGGHSALGTKDYTGFLGVISSPFKGLTWLGAVPCIAPRDGIVVCLWLTAMSAIVTPLCWSHQFKNCCNQTMKIPCPSLQTWYPFLTVEYYFFMEVAFLWIQSVDFKLVTQLASLKWRNPLLSYSSLSFPCPGRWSGDNILVVSSCLSLLPTQTYVPWDKQGRPSWLACIEVLTQLMVYIITLVRHKKARFDTKMHGSTQKSPVRHKNARFDTKMPFPACISWPCHYQTSPPSCEKCFFPISL